MLTEIMAEAMMRIPSKCLRRDVLGLCAVFYPNFFVMFISDGKAVSKTFSAMPASSRLSIPFGVGGQIYTRFPNEPANSH
jgi:hypothetical protein